MAGAKERRIAPRKTCVVPLRFRVLSGVVGVGVASDLPGSMAGTGSTPRWPSPGRAGIQDGETANISERGIYFTSSMKLSVGEPLEMYFTMPSELTGRSAESVKCDARVVHVDSHANGSLGVGAVIEKLEPLEKVRSWAN
jgi:PilZ domain-containing protein